MRAHDQARAIRRVGARDQGEEAGDALRALAEHLDAARRLVDLPLGGDKRRRPRTRRRIKTH
jgi:hypothetical protein